ncbi:MAG: PAS domain S-box protein [Bacteroidales bacterium]
MTLSNYSDKRFGENELHEDEDQLKSGQNTSSPDKKLLLGTVQFYESVLDSMGDLYIAVFNKSGKHIEVWSGPEQKIIFGINPFEFKGRLLEESYDNKAAKTIQLLLDNAFISGNKLSDRVQILFPNNTFWFNLTLSPYPKSSKTPATIVCFFQNITETVLLEEKVQQMQAREKSANDLKDEDSLLLNSKGIVTVVSKSLLEISGYSKEDFIGYKYNKIPVFQEYCLPLIQSIFEAALAGRKSGSHELRWKTNANQTIWTEVVAKPIRNSAGPCNVKFSFKDISDRKFLENELLKSKQAYKIIIENANDAIFILQDGLVKFSNSQLLDMVDCSLDELLKFPFIDLLHPDDKDTFADIVIKRHHKTSEGAANVRLLKKDKSFYWIEVKSVYIDWDSKPATLLYFSDISERRAKDELLNQKISEYQVLSEESIDFGTLTNDDEIFTFTGKKIIELPSISAVLLISYDNNTNSPRIEHIEGPGEIRQNLMSIINSNVDEFTGKINQDLIKNISYGKLIKYNDGLFEHGHTIFPKNTFNLIQKVLNVSGIYLIGFTHKETVFGTALIFTPEGKKLEHPGTIETIIKLASASLARKQNLNKLRLSEQKYRRVFESYQDIYFHTDVEGVIMEVSPSIKNILGYESKEVEGKLITNFFSNNLLLDSFLKTLIKNKYFSDKDIELKNKEGNPIFASLSASILRDERNRLIGFEGFIRDISERKNAEDLYQQSEEKFRTFADFTYDWEYWTSPDGDIIYMSPSCERISGYNAGNSIKTQTCFD